MDKIVSLPLCFVDCSLAEAAAKDCGLDAALAVDIISMVINLRTNAEILSFVQKKYDVKGKGHSIIRSINPLIKSFILFNFEAEFRSFCTGHRISLFNADLDSQKKNSSHARMTYVVFLRETLSGRKSGKAASE
jgi:hypothetical protein